LEELEVRSNEKKIVNYLVNDSIKNKIEGFQYISVDGNVIGNDIMFDHHKPNGAPVQMDELPDEFLLSDKTVFCTLNVDEDAVISTMILKNGGLSAFNGAQKDELRHASLSCDQLIKPNALFYYLKDYGFQLQMKYFHGKKELNDQEKASFYSKMVDFLEIYMKHRSPLKLDPKFNGKFEGYLDKQRVRFFLIGFQLINKNCGFIDISQTGAVSPHVMYELARQKSVEVILIKYSNKQNTNGSIFTIGIDPNSELDKEKIFPLFEELNALDPNIDDIHKWAGRAGVGGSPYKHGSGLTAGQIMNLLDKNFN
jgi:hypothetical protein